MKPDELGPMSATQARICLSPQELEEWRAEYASRLALGSSVRDAERFATQMLSEERAKVGTPVDK